MKSLREFFGNPEHRAEMEFALIGAMVLVGAVCLFWLQAGAPRVQVGPVEFGFPSPTPTATPEPLTCKFVRVPGRLAGADLCTMPDGTQCLFDRGSEPTICYSVRGDQ